jgi:hypothetical protein
LNIFVKSDVLKGQHFMNQNTFLACLLLTQPLLAGQQQLSSSDHVPEGLEKSDWQSIRAAHEAWKHEFRQVEGVWQASNPGQRWTISFDGRGFIAKPNESAWNWGLQLHSYGFSSNQQMVSGTPEVKTREQRLSYHWQGGLEEWFVNDGRGLEHGFTVPERPKAVVSGEPLVFTLQTMGSLSPSVSQDVQTVYFRDAAGAPVLHYAGLKVWDANGNILTSRFEQGHDGKFQIAIEEAGATYPITIDPIAQQAYLKASNTPSGGTGTFDSFGTSVSVSGNTVVVGAPGENSSTKGVNTAPNENAGYSGAAFVFVRNGTSWSQQAYLKASNTGKNDEFGSSVAIITETIVVGARFEASSTKGVNTTPNDASFGSGAAYVFVRSGTVWSQQAYLKASNAGENDAFGTSVAFSNNTLVVGAPGESSSSKGINSTPNEDASNAGAAYVFIRSGTTWSQQAYLKASNSGEDDEFGISVAASADTLVVGAAGESSNTQGVNTSPNDFAFDSGAAYVFFRSGTTWTQQAYLKASNTGVNDKFGVSVAVSSNTLVVGASQEDSSTTSVNSTPNESAENSGAAYVFVRSGSVWSQQAYLKARNSGTEDQFGTSVSVSGETLVVGAPFEASSSKGVNSTANNTSSASGAAYVFIRSGTTWSQQAYLKASNSGMNDEFGTSVAVSSNTVIVGARFEASSTNGINTTSDNGAEDSGAAYVFFRNGTAWAQEAYMKHSGNLPGGDYFGSAVAVSGNTVVVGAAGEDSSTKGVNSTPNESGSDAGAAYVFVRNGSTWTQQAYLKASNTGISDYFGTSVAIAANIIVVGAPGEDSSTTGVNSTSNNTAVNSGAAYVFVRNGSTWTQQAYLKASNTGSGDFFGDSVAVSATTVVVGAPDEDGGTTGVNSVPNENASDSGAAYVFTSSGTVWSQQAYLKASNTEEDDEFGTSVSISGNSLIVGAPGEDSSTKGVNSSPNNIGIDSGAAYVFTRNTAIWSQQAYLKASNTSLYDAFGTSVAISENIAVVGAPLESSSTTGVNTSSNENSPYSGAAYAFIRSGTVWTHQAYIKPLNTDFYDFFGSSVAVSGETIVVGALFESSSTIGINTTPNNNALWSGAAYVFVRSSNIWSQQAYLKASNTGAEDFFGASVAVSEGTVVVGAFREDSNTKGVNSTPNNSGFDSGAVYIFTGF